MHRCCFHRIAKKKATATVPITAIRLFIHQHSGILACARIYASSL
jgi:hypothetical protein